LSDLTAVSLFAGVGGFDLAFQRAGVKITAAVEIDKKCRDVLALQFPETKLFDDVKEVTGEQLRATGFIPERGIIAGGFPCQDLSIAGLRRGLDGARSGLFYEIIRLTDELKPQFLILENVGGLLSSQRGKDMGIVITALVERGYGVCWRMLDSQNFGVPQRRRRVFIVASLGDHRKPAEILFERESGFWDIEAGRKKRKATSNSAERSIGVNSFQKSKRAQTVDDDESWVESEIVPTLNVFDSGDSRTTTVVTQEPILFEGNRVGDPRFHDKVSPSVMARWGTGGNNVPMAFNMRSDDTNNRMDVYEANTATSLTALQPSPLSHRSQTFIAQRQSNSEYKIDDKASTISQRDYKSATDLVINNPIPIQDGREINKKQNGSGIGYENAPAYTLDTLGAQAIATNIVRRLTPKECERLQGFPDDWTASQADSSRYKMMGNAVTVPVVEWIIKRMVKLVVE
jgi:DNA (cytosine-5)-methyltransferase 1